MTNSALGTKRGCVKCGVQFYDLNKNPATCPKCNHQFDAESAARGKRRLVKKNEDASPAAKATASPRKADIQRKKKVDDEEGSASDIAEMEDIEDIEGIAELDGAESEHLNDDDADDEAILEELDAGDKKLVNNVEEEEAESLVEEIEDEQKEISKSVKTSKKK